jgi:hypothetical protein
MDVTVERLREDRYAEWSRFVTDSPGGSAYSLPEYLDALCSAGGGRFAVLVVRHGDAMAGGVALYERDSRFGAYVSPRLLLYYNGPVLVRYETTHPYRATSRHLKSLVALEAALSSAGYGVVVLKARPPLSDLRPFLKAGWSGSLGYSYVVPVDDRDAIRGRMEQNLRRLVDRNVRDGLTLTEDDDVDAFLDLHEATMARVGAAPYLPRESFRTFVRRLRHLGLASVFHARLPDGQSIASQFVLLGHPVTHTVCAGVDSAHIRSGASAFLRSGVFERLHARGYAANDLTDAWLNSVTRFKGQLGGTLEPWLELRSPSSRLYRWGNGSLDRLRALRYHVGAALRGPQTGTEQESE